jgi:MFS family permease
MVGPSELPNAVALNAGLFNASRVVGPAIAGGVIATIGTGACFVINAVSFLAVLAALASMRPEELHPVVRSTTAGLLRGTREAFTFARHDPELRVVLVVVTLVSTVGFNFHVLVPLLASNTLDVGPEGFGVLSAAFGFGALLGALASATSHGASWRLLSLGGSGFGVLSLLLAPVEQAVVAGALLVAIGVCFTLFTANANALVQLRAPDQLRGRMIGIYLFAFVGTAPIGGLFAGALADIGGTPLAFGVAGATALLTIALASARRAQIARRSADVAVA